MVRSTASAPSSWHAQAASMARSQAAFCRSLLGPMKPPAPEDVFDQLLRGGWQTKPLPDVPLTPPAALAGDVARGAKMPPEQLRTIGSSARCSTVSACLPSRPPLERSRRAVMTRSTRVRMRPWNPLLMRWSKTEGSAPGGPTAAILSVESFSSVILLPLDDISPWQPKYDSDFVWHSSKFARTCSSSVRSIEASDSSEEGPGCASAVPRPLDERGPRLNARTRSTNKETAANAASGMPFASSLLLPMAAARGSRSPLRRKREQQACNVEVNCRTKARPAGVSRSNSCLTSATSLSCIDKPGLWLKGVRTCDGVNSCAVCGGSAMRWVIKLIALASKGAPSSRRSRCCNTLERWHSMPGIKVVSTVLNLAAKASCLLAWARLASMWTKSENASKDKTLAAIVVRAANKSSHSASRSANSCRPLVSTTLLEQMLAKTSRREARCMPCQGPLTMYASTTLEPE
mmetsp:Transcript_43714/g.125064  ORF Transcript_43714/g.125064 Transcript_43714/m.125064 type:complete len:461 (-) Transcript_43714:517-1899(-)